MAAHNMVILYFPKLSKCPGIFLIPSVIVILIIMVTVHATVHLQRILASTRTSNDKYKGAQHIRDIDLRNQGRVHKGLEH